MKGQNCKVELPATPNNLAPSISRLAVHTATGPSIQGSMLDPSPASTRGETNGGDSSPITPAKVDDSVVVLPLMRSNHNGKVDPVHDGGEYVPRVENEQSDDRLATKGNTAGLDHTPRTSHSQSRAVSPASGHVHLRDWQSHNVRFATQSNESDPFLVDRSGKGKDSPIAAEPTGAAEESQAAYQPREGREVGEISGDNAQAIFSPSACVFVANLAVTSLDEQLESEVSRVFQQFGKVYVKIKRDNRGMPYAFCQYENEKDAEKAISLGHGLLIQGRACRTERARVNRSLYLSRTSGGSISESHARVVLAGYGPLEKLWTSSATDREMFRLPDGIWVTFAFFQDCRDAQAGFKDSSDYRLEQPALPEDIRQRVERAKLSPFARSSPLRGRLSSPLGAHTQRLANSSIFIGNLPSNVSLDSLREHFQTCGTIRATEIIAKTNVHAPGQSVFAFIEFSSEIEARRAMGIDTLLEGRRLRVELRESQEYGPPRYSSFNSAGSPRNRGCNGSASLRSSNSLEAAMTRALALGIPAATTVQIFDPQKAENMENLPQTPLVSSIYPGFHYYNSPYSQYSPYGGASSNSETGNTSLAMYSPMNAAQGTVAQYPYSSVLNGTNYTSAYQLSPYIYPSMSSENNSAATNQGAFHGEQAQS